MNWFSIRKGVCICHFEYGGFWTDLFVTDTKYRDTPQGFELSIDLNKNLRTNNKTENTYVDCIRLGSNIAELTTVQVHDKPVWDAVARRSRLEQGTHLFRLTIVLSQREHTFEAQAVPGVDPLTIRLTSVSPLGV